MIISKIECGKNSSYFLERDSGKVLVCGKNEQNNLGFSGGLRTDAEKIWLPTLNGLSGVNNLASGISSTMAWNSDNQSLFFWGDNTFNQLGVKKENGEDGSTRFNTSLDRSQLSASGCYEGGYLGSLRYECRLLFNMYYRCIQMCWFLFELILGERWQV